MQEIRGTISKFINSCRNSKHKLRVHVLQSAAAGLFILIMFLAVNYFQNNLAVTSLGASAFIAFSFPSANSSRPRLLIGGYIVGVIIGILCAGLTTLLDGIPPFPAYIPACALAVFVSMLLMTVLNFEHPPAAALAVAITIDSRPVAKGVAGLICIILLCVVKELLKKYLRHLSYRGEEGNESEDTDFTAKS